MTSRTLQPKTLPQQPEINTIIAWSPCEVLSKQRTYYSKTEKLIKEIGQSLSTIQRDYSYEKAVSMEQPQYSITMKKHALEHSAKTAKEVIEKHNVTYLQSLEIAHKLKLYFEELIGDLEGKEDKAYQRINEIEKIYLNDLSKLGFKDLTQETKIEGDVKNQLETKAEIDLNISIFHTKDSKKEFSDSLKSILNFLVNRAAEKDLLEVNFSVFLRRKDPTAAALFWTGKQESLAIKVEEAKKVIKNISEAINGLDKIIPTALSESKPRFELEKAQLEVMKLWVEQREKEVAIRTTNFEDYIKKSEIDIKGVKEKPHFFPEEEQKVLLDLLTKDEICEILGFDAVEKKANSKINDLLPLTTKAKELSKMALEIVKKIGSKNASETLYTVLKGNVDILNIKLDESYKRTDQLRESYAKIVSHISLLKEDANVIKQIGEKIATIQAERKIWAEGETPKLKENDRRKTQNSWLNLSFLGK